MSHGSHFSSVLFASWFRSRPSLSHNPSPTLLETDDDCDCDYDNASDSDWENVVDLVPEEGMEIREWGLVSN